MFLSSPFTAEHLGELELAELIVLGGPLLYTLSSMLGSCERNQNNVGNIKQKEVTLKTSTLAPHRSRAHTDRLANVKMLLMGIYT